MSPIMRLALPVLAIAGSAYAACSATSTLVIQNSGDASAIASCKTYKGDIAIQTDAPGPIALDGVKEIQGSFIVKDNNATREISADSLEIIDQTLEVNNVANLNSLRFPKLKAVKEINMQGLPNLMNLGFDAQVTKAQSVSIDNTELQSLDGINIETVDMMLIANNRLITSISMQLGNISGELIFLGNNPSVQVEFPNLIWANNMTFRNCSSVKIPSIVALNNSLTAVGNLFESFSAPNLTEVGGALVITDNVELGNLSLPLLEEVSYNLEIANNTKLHEINQLPKLQSIGGALDFNGNITKLELPSLNDVKGTFNVQSTGDIQGTCDTVFSPLHDDMKIKGEFVCRGQLEQPGGEGTIPGASNNNGGKKGAASGLSVQIGALLAGLAAAFLL